MSTVEILTEGDLDQFTGTCNYYRNFLGLKYTDGVKYVADKAGAYRLIDAVASHQIDPKIRRNQRLQEFQLWTLKVDLAKHSCVLTCQSDSDEPCVVKQVIEYTDFPLAEIRFYVEGGVMLLPSEH